MLLLTAIFLHPRDETGFVPLEITQKRERGENCIMRNLFRVLFIQHYVVTGVVNDVAAEVVKPHQSLLIAVTSEFQNSVKHIFITIYNRSNEQSDDLLHDFKKNRKSAR